MTRPLQLMSKWLGFYRAGSIMRRRKLVLSVIYLLRPGLGDDISLRWPVFCRLRIFGKLLNECELEGCLSSVHPL